MPLNYFHFDKDMVWQVYIQLQYDDYYIMFAETTIPTIFSSRSLESSNEESTFISIESPITPSQPESESLTTTPRSAQSLSVVAETEISAQGKLQKR